MTKQNFSEMLIQNSQFLTPFSISLTHDEEASKDLIQDTLYRALVNKDKYQNGTNLRAWLYTIMRNVFINNYRRQKKFKKVSAETPQDYYLYKTGRTTENEGSTRSRVKEIKAAIGNLPHVFRSPFEMHFAGYKYQEIALVLNEPLGTIKSRIHFARKILKTKVERY